MPVVRTEIKNALLIALLATMAAFYFENTPIPQFLTLLQSSLIAAAILWSAGGIGSCLLQWIRQPALSPLEYFLFAETLGLGLLSLTMFLMGVFRVWIPGVAWTIILLGLFASSAFMRNLRSFSASLAPGEGLQPHEVRMPVGTP